MSDLLSALMAITICAMGLALCYFNMLFYFQCHKPWRWIKLMYGVIGISFAILYAAVLFGARGVAMAWVRPMIMVTLAIMLSGTIVSKSKDC